MTDDIRRAGGAAGPPWPVDLLADLHAGVLGETEAARLWPLVDADPDARAVLDALDSVSSSLAGLRTAVAPMPTHLSARLDAAIEAESRARSAAITATVPTPQLAPLPRVPHLAPVAGIDRGRRRRARAMAWGAGLLTAAAVAVVVTVAVLPGAPDTGGTPQAAPIEVDSANLGVAALRAEGRRDYGPLGDQRRLEECFAASGVELGTAEVAGVQPITLDGRRGVMVLLVGGGGLRVVVVEPDCGPGSPGKIVDTPLGAGLPTPTR